MVWKFLLVDTGGMKTVPGHIQFLQREAFFNLHVTAASINISNVVISLMDDLFRWHERSYGCIIITMQFRLSGENRAFEEVRYLDIQLCKG